MAQGNLRTRLYPLSILLGALALTAPAAAPQGSSAKPEFSEQVIFPEETHAWYRIPSLVTSKNGVLLAFAERRIGTAHDYGHDSEQCLRRSFDNGKTWGPIQTILSEKHLDPDSGPVVVDYVTGRIFRTFKWVSSAVRSAEWDTEHPEEMKKMGTPPTRSTATTTAPRGRSRAT